MSDHVSTNKDKNKEIMVPHPFLRAGVERWDGLQCKNLLLRVC